MLGWRDVPTDDSGARPERGRGRAGASARSSSAAAAADEPASIRTMLRFERKLYVIRKRIEHAVDAMPLRRIAASFYVPSLSSRTLIYKGMLTATQIEPMFPDLADPGLRVGARARAPALQHEHVPVLAAGASVPLHRAQRRDQHAARQHQLDAGARGAARIGRASATTCRRSCRSSAKGAATRRPSTTCSSSWSWPGRSLPHAVLMMIPEPWQNHESDEPRSCARSTSTTRR